MYSFCQEFYKRLVKGDSVQKSLNHGKSSLKNCLKGINKKLQICNLNEKMIGDGAVLLPEDFDHEQSLYGNKHWRSTELKQGKLIDMSRNRGPTNIPKMVEPLTGRRIEMHKVAKYVSQFLVLMLRVMPTFILVDFLNYYRLLRTRLLLSMAQVG